MPRKSRAGIGNEELQKDGVIIRAGKMPRPPQCILAQNKKDEGLTTPSPVHQKIE